MAAYSHHLSSTTVSDTYIYNRAGITSHCIWYFHHIYKLRNMFSLFIYIAFSCIPPLILSFLLLLHPLLLLSSPLLYSPFYIISFYFLSSIILSPPFLSSSLLSSLVLFLYSSILFSHILPYPFLSLILFLYKYIAYIVAQLHLFDLL